MNIWAACLQVQGRTAQNKELIMVCGQRSRTDMLKTGKCTCAYVPSAHMKEATGFGLVPWLCQKGFVGTQPSDAARNASSLQGASPSS